MYTCSAHQILPLYKHIYTLSIICLCKVPICQWYRYLTLWFHSNLQRRKN